MTYEEAYIAVCKGYKEGISIKNLIEDYLYTLDPAGEYPAAFFYDWLGWACSISHDDESNPVLILCMADYIMKEEYSNIRCGIKLNDRAAAAMAIVDTINMFALGGGHPPTNIIGAAIRYLYNNESINTIISSATFICDIECVSELPDCEVEYIHRKELVMYIEEQSCRHNYSECPF